MALSGFIATAQTEQGGWLVGANSNLDFSSTSFDGNTDNRTSIDIEVGIGYFLVDNLATGLNFGFSNTKQGYFKNSLIGIGPFTRYYVGGTFFLGASFLALSGKIENGHLGSEEKISGNALAFEAGYPIWIVDNVAIEPGLNYAITFGDDIDNNNSFGLKVGFNLYF